MHAWATGVSLLPSIPSPYPLEFGEILRADLVGMQRRGSEKSHCSKGTVNYAILDDYIVSIVSIVSMTTLLVKK